MGLIFKYIRYTVQYRFLVSQTSQTIKFSESEIDREGCVSKFRVPDTVPYTTERQTSEFRIFSSFLPHWHRLCQVRSISVENNISPLHVHEVPLPFKFYGTNQKYLLYCIHYPEHFNAELKTLKMLKLSGTGWK